MQNGFSHFRNRGTRFVCLLCNPNPILKPLMKIISGNYLWTKNNLLQYILLRIIYDENLVQKYIRK